MDHNTRNLVKLAESLVAHSAPIRVGIVLSVEAASSVYGSDNPGVAILCAFNYISQVKDPQQALNFLIDVSNNDS